MIQKKLEEIAEADLDNPLANGVSEGKTIDYKRSLPGNSDGEKKEFLANVSSFANTAGGDFWMGPAIGNGQGRRSANGRLASEITVKLISIEKC